MKHTFDKTYSLGIDVGGSNVRFGIVDQNNQVFELEVLKSKDISHQLMDVIKEKYTLLKHKYNIDFISIGFPGIVDSANKLILNIPNQKGFETSHDIKALETSLSIPIWIENDVNCLLEYDAYRLGLDAKQSVLGFYIGTGFGNAIRIDGTMIRGEKGAAGEIGHMPIIGITERCGCGNMGCLETQASGVALKRIHQQYYQHTALDDIFIKHHQDKPMQLFVEYIALGISTAIVMLDIHRVIMGGGICRMVGFPQAYLESLVKAHLRTDFQRHNLKIMYAQSLPQDGVIGAVLIGRKMLKYSHDIGMK